LLLLCRSRLLSAKSIEHSLKQKLDCLLRFALFRTLCIWRRLPIAQGVATERVRLGARARRRSHRRDSWRHNIRPHNDPLHTCRRDIAGARRGPLPRDRLATYIRASILSCNAKCHRRALTRSCRKSDNIRTGLRTTINRDVSRTLNRGRRRICHFDELRATQSVHSRAADSTPSALNQSARRKRCARRARRVDTNILKSWYHTGTIR
jgi:hypothetical protein